MIPYYPLETLEDQRRWSKMEEKNSNSWIWWPGVMAIGQLLTYAGMIEDKNVSWLPSYGPEMRGGQQTAV